MEPRKFFTIAIGLVVFAAILLVVLLVAASSDSRPPDTSDLVLERKPVPAEENAFTHFSNALETIHWPENSPIPTNYLENGTVDESALSSLLASNAVMFSHVRKGAACTNMLGPEITGFDSKMPWVAGWRNIARLMAVKIRHDRTAKRHSEATATCTDLLKFGDLLTTNPETIIEYLVGVAVLDAGLRSATDIARDPDTPRESLAAIADAVSRISPPEKGFTRAIKAEFKVESNAIDMFAEGKYGMDEIGSLGSLPRSSFLRKARIPRYLFLPNKTKALCARYARHSISNAANCLSAIPKYDLEKELGIGTSRRPNFLTPNAVGRILLGLLIPAMDAMQERRCRMECTVSATKIILACKLRNVKEPGLPQDLQSLVPEHLPAVPRDPFDGKPFRYSYTNAIIYSVGKDLKDSGGSTNTPSSTVRLNVWHARWQCDDAVFELK